MLPRPRNFTGGLYKIRTTASGQLPTDADLQRAIDQGLPGSAMPGWRGRLSDTERRNVVAYIKSFSSFFADTSQHVVPLKFSSPPGGGTGAAALKDGVCQGCHQKLSAMELSRLKRGGGVKRCEYCRRILVDA